MYRIWIGLNVNAFLGVFMGALGLLVFWLHLWAFPLVGYDGNTRDQQRAPASADAAAPTR
jgi:hypothetical protein